MNLINWSLSPARIQVDALMLQLGLGRESKCREKKRIAKASDCMISDNIQQGPRHLTFDCAFIHAPNHVY